MRSLISLSWQSVGYGFGILGRQLIIYLTLPFFTNEMPQTEFGLVSFSVAIMGFANTLTTAGLHGAVFRFYHDYDDPQRKQKVLGSSLLLLTLLASLPAFFLMFFAYPISQNVLNNIAYAPVIQVTSILLIVDTLVNYGYILLRLQVRPLATSASNLLIVTFQMGIALLLVYVFAGGALGYLLGLLVGEIIGLCLLVWLTRHIITLDISMLSIGELLRYGLPLLPAALSMWTLNLADRFLIGVIAGLEQLAIYEVGYKVASLVAFAIAPFRVAWPPFAFSIMHKDNSKRVYRDVFTYLIMISLFCVLGLLAFRKEILSLLAPLTYASALPVIGWVAIAKVFEASYTVLSIGSKISKRTITLSAVAVASAGVYLILNVVLILFFGIQGAAIATLIGYMLIALSAYVVSQRSYPFQLDWFRLIRIVGIGLFSYIFIDFVDRSQIEGWSLYFSKIGAWLSFLFLSVLTGVITFNQLYALSSIVYTQFRKRIH